MSYVVRDGSVLSRSVTSNIDLPGKAVQETGKNVVVSNTNATNSLAIIRIYSGGTGTILAGEGATVSRFSVGAYAVTFSTPFADIPAVSVIVEQPSAPRIATVNGLSVSGFNIVIWNVSSGTVDEQFQFIAIGQRA